MTRRLLIGCCYSTLATVTMTAFGASPGTWTQANLSQPRLRVAATSAGSLAFFAGGFTQTDHDNNSAILGTDIVDVYNANNGSWTTTNLSQPRDYVEASSVEGKAYFVGGWHNGPSSVVDIY